MEPNDTVHNVPVPPKRPNNAKNRRKIVIIVSAIIVVIVIVASIMTWLFLAHPDEAKNTPNVDSNVTNEDELLPRPTDPPESVPSKEIPKPNVEVDHLGSSG